MRKTIKVEKYPFPRGGDPAATYILEAGDQKEVTVCLKFRTFAYNEGFGCPFAMTTECDEGPENKSCVDWFTWHYCIGWKTGMEDDNKQAGHTEIFYSHDNQTSQEQSIQMAEKTRWHFNLYEDWLDLFEWQSACYAISVIKRKELLYVNGKFIQGYEWPKQFRKGWGDYPLILKLMVNWRGEVTDLNIYDSAFEKEEMVSWTTSCGFPADGGILPWLPDLYNITNNNDTEVLISEVASDDLCSSQASNKNVLELFDDGTGKSPAMSEEICARLNGRLKLIPMSDNEAFDILEEFEDYVVKANRSGFSYWLGGMASINKTEMVEVDENYQVYPKGGRWVISDPYTENILGIPNYVVPTGHTYAKLTQECFGCWSWYMRKPEELSSFDGKLCKGQFNCQHYFNCFAQKCDRSDMGLAFICDFKEKVKLRLKGLCKEAKVDTDYLLLGYEVLEQGGGHRRKYGGSTGWLLAHNKEEDIWQLQHNHYPHLSLTMEDKDSLPVGLHSWVAANNTCSLGQTVSVQLQLSACKPDQFTCHNGKCVRMESRCDNVEVAFLQTPQNSQFLTYRIVRTAAMRRTVGWFPLTRRNT